MAVNTRIIFLFLLVVSFACSGVSFAGPSADRIFYGNKVFLFSEHSLREFANGRYSSVEGDLIITVNTVESFSVLEGRLVEIGGSLIIKSGSLKSLKGLDNLKHIGGDFVVSAPGITSLEGLSSLESIGGRMVLDSCSSLKSFVGLERLMSLGKGFEFNPSDDTDAIPVLRYYNDNVIWKNHRFVIIVVLSMIILVFATVSFLTRK